MRRVHAAIAALVVVGVLLAGCSSSGGAGASATPDPAIAFCPALDAYGQSLVALQKLDPSTPVEQQKAAVDDAKAKLAALIPLAQPFAGMQLSTLTTAQAQLESAVNALPSGATPAMAQAALKDPINAVVQQIAATHNATCNTRPSPSTTP
jgi:hypothetical protein